MFDYTKAKLKQIMLENAIFEPPYSLIERKQLQADNLPNPNPVEKLFLWMYKHNIPVVRQSKYAVKFIAKRLRIYRDTESTMNQKTY